MSPSSAALITGASRGIGEAIARALAANGTPVALLALHSDRLAKVADEITEAGGTAVMRAVDVREAEAVREAVRELATELAVPISLVVNNAGRIDREVPLWQADPSQWRDVVETNLIGSFHVSHATIPLMLEHGGGRVIELVSGAGAKDWAKASAYVSSKAAMIRNVGHLHEAGFAQGLRSFALSPGTVKTDMSTSMQLHAERTEFTPASLTTDLVLAIHRGDLDNWSGKYLRVTHDSAKSLIERVRSHGAPAESTRRLAITPWADDDPLRTESLVPKRT
jgi:3-oxoacyl-[acyl-carrier protein] reductase